MRGDFRAEDLSSLFLNLRQRNFYCSTFLEIGDFIAHKDEREKGPATSLTRDTATWVRYAMPRFNKNVVHVPKVAEFANAMRAQLNIVLRTQEKPLGLRPEVAKSALGVALKKITRIVGTTYNVSRPLTERERTLVEYLNSQFIFDSAFDTETIFVEFIRVLQKNKLLNGNEIALLNYIKPHLTLFAATSMHGSKLILADGDYAELNIDADAENRLIVTANFHMKSYLPQVVVTSFPLLTGDMQLLDCIGNELLDGDTVRLDIPLELGSDGLLHELGA